MANLGFGVPEIYEHEAEGDLEKIYGDIQTVLKVPFVNFIFRTLALYETFLAISWDQVRWNMLTIDMEQAAEALRYPDISVEIPKVNWTEIYDLATIEQIKRVVFLFNYVNPKLLLIASAWAESLSNRPIEGSGPHHGFMEPGVIQGMPRIHMVEPNQASPAVQDLFADIMQKHHSLDVASDYRALANYPAFLSKSWAGLKSYVGTDEYNLLKKKLKTKSIKFAHERMPFPVTVNPDVLYHYYHPRDIAGIMAIVSMFQNLLPGLIIEGEFLDRCFSDFLL